MRAFIFSIGEATTDLCVWSLERQGFEVVLYHDQTTLWQKLKRLYTECDDGAFIRVDADIVANRNVLSFAQNNLKNVWWYQSTGYDWYKQDLSVISVSLMSNLAVQVARKHIDEAQYQERPETYIWRLKEFHEPRRCIVLPTITGIHGFGQKQKDIERVNEAKKRRRQDDLYDWDLMAKINELKIEKL